MKKLVIILVGGLMLGPPTIAAASVEAEVQQAAVTANARTQTPVLYVIHYRSGPTWRAGRPLSEQGLERHGAYMRELAARGDLLVAGPLTTVEGGLVVLQVADMESAIALMQADPAVQEGQFFGEVSVWRPVIDPGVRFSGNGD